MFFRCYFWLKYSGHKYDYEYKYFEIVHEHYSSTNTKYYISAYKFLGSKQVRYISSSIDNENI